MNQEIICIICPLGCRMDVELEGSDVRSVKGNQCKKGIKHAQKEVTFPGRILTTTVRTDIPGVPHYVSRIIQFYCTHLRVNVAPTFMVDISEHVDAKRR